MLSFIIGMVGKFIGTYVKKSTLQPHIDLFLNGIAEEAAKTPNPYDDLVVKFFKLLAGKK